MLRRVVGDSMLPTLKPGQLVIAAKRLQPEVGKLVIVRHRDREIIKRLVDMNENQLYIIGDNELHSSDSRSFGWIAKDNLLASVIWPKI